MLLMMNSFIASDLAMSQRGCHVIFPYPCPINLLAMLVVGFCDKWRFSVLDFGLAGVACVAVEDEGAAQLVAHAVFGRVGIDIGAA